LRPCAITLTIVSSVEMWAVLQNSIHEHLVQPVLFFFGLMNYAEIAFDAIEWVVIGAVEVALLALCLGFAQKYFGYSAAVTAGLSEFEKKSTRRTDIAYTLLHRLGLFPLIAFALLTPPLDWAESQLRLLGWPAMNIDQMVPGVTDQALMSFLIYLVVLDFIDYWLHRGQHGIQWLWELHAVHHSQRHMTYWSDQRNHLLEDLIRDGALAAIALLIGVAPEQFIGLVVVSRVLQSVAHADWDLRNMAPNSTIWQNFLSLGQRVMVGPRFHRVHHGIGIGHEGRARGVNFGVLFSFWDIVFRSADFHSAVQPTGIRDQLTGADYGRGFFSHQYLAIKRIFGRA
jgi:sterol desaturase/sphingolipid hydroxylase (fatty acid hydroxylase superfamily)